MDYRSLLALATASCISVPDYVAPSVDDAAPADALTISPARVRHITITPSPAPAEPLGPTPIAIRWTADPDFAANAANDGSDLLVIDSDGDVLPHEIEHINVPAGDLVLWVRLERLSAAGETLDLFYGAARAGANDPSLVFADALMVWHFGDFGASQGEVVDSAGANTGTPSLVAAAGTFGDGATISGVPITTAAARPIYPDAAPFTMSFWLRSTVGAGTALRIGSIENVPTFGAEYVFNGATAWTFQSKIPGEGPNSSAIPASLSDGEFNHASIHIERGAQTTFIARLNGVLVATHIHGASGSLSETNPLVLGNGVTGTFDEVRVYRRERSTDELSIERQNALSDAFISVGPAESAGR